MLDHFYQAVLNNEPAPIPLKVASATNTKGGFQI